MKTLEQNIIKYIRQNKLVAPGNKILVALSGGADSVFALSFFSKFEKLFKIKLYAAHINHNLRNIDSENDEIFCRELCVKKGIDFVSESVNVKSYARSNKKSIEEASRELRYSKLQTIAKRFK